jgi:hypothetical protein
VLPSRAALRDDMDRRGHADAIGRGFGLIGLKVNKVLCPAQGGNIEDRERGDLLYKVRQCGAH